MIYLPKSIDFGDNFSLMLISHDFILDKELQNFIIIEFLKFPCNICYYLMKNHSKF